MATGVLIVEDEFLLRANAVDFFEGAGFIVYDASNADEAIALLELHDDIRVVFTDINMQGSMDGLKLAHYIRGRWPPVKLILVSGKTLLDKSHLPTEAQFFAKPYDDGAILETMIQMLSGLKAEHLRPSTSQASLSAPLAQRAK